MCPPMQENEADAITGQATAATSSVALSIADGPLSFDLKPISSDGTFAESDAMEITASTDSYSGYTLSIAAQNGDNATKLINTDTTNCPATETKCFIAPLGSIVTKNDYASPADSTAAAAVKNKWGFSPSEYLDGGTSVDNSATDGTEKYLPISTAATNLAKTMAANSGTPDTYRMKIGARVGGDIAMGTYENTFVIAAVGNGAAYTINYADNSGEATGMPGVQTGMTPDIIVKLSGDQPIREGYDFAGWCSVNNADNVFSCGGNIYQPGGNFGIDQTSENSITLYAIWEGPCPTNTICYKANGANVGENDPKMGNQTANYSENTNSINSNMAVNLWPVNFKYDINGDGYNDYGFVGWSEDKNAANIINAVTGKPTVYGPMQNITTGDLSVNGLKLYAVWVPVAKDKDGNELTFQTEGLLATQLTETAGDTLASKPNEYITALRDERDNQVYAVAKLKDGNYWMIENLRLNTTGSNDGTKAQGFGGVFSGLAKAESANFSSSTTANSLYSTTNITGSNQGYRFPRYNNKNTNSPVANMTSTSDNIYSYGNYYTWAAAIANTNDYTGPEVKVNDKTSETANTSICPSGWRLPYGRDTGNGTASGGFYNLNYKINNDSSVTDATASKNLRAYPNNFVYSGVFDTSSAYSRGSFGYYWSSTAGGSIGAYSLSFFSSSVSPGTYNLYKYYGNSVRCVLGSRSSASQE